MDNSNEEDSDSVSFFIIVFYIIYKQLNIFKILSKYKSITKVYT